MLNVCKKFTQKLAKYKNYWKVRDHCHFSGKHSGATQNICNQRFNMSNELSVDFHNGAHCDNNFIKREIANKFKGQFECLGENTE